MLAKGNKITNENDFRRARVLGKRVQTDSFTLDFYKRGDSENTRFGITVSKIASKNATKRNAIKRALNEALRHELSFIKPGYDCVFWAKPPAGTKYTNELMAEVKEILAKAKLIK